MPADWVSIAIFATASIGLVNIIDSHLISRRMPSFRAFLLPVAVVTLTYALIVLYLFPLPGDIGEYGDRLLGRQYPVVSGYH